MVTGGIPPEQLRWIVSCYTSNDGNWYWQLCEHLLPATTLMKIGAISPLKEGIGDDRIYWAFSQDGSFKTKSAYSFISSSEGRSKEPLWRGIWIWAGPKRVRHYLWLAAKGRLLTNEERVCRHMSGVLDRHRCPGVKEPLLHVLRDCPQAAIMWIEIVPVFKRTTFFNMEAKDWLLTNIKNGLRLDVESWPTVFGITSWKIWNWRNEAVFAANDYNVTTKLLVVMVDHVKVVKKSWSDAKKLKVPQGRNEIRLLPLEGWAKLNTDGSANPSTGMASAGGVLRDNDGNWRGGFIPNLGFCSILGAKLRGLLYGLQVAWSLGFRRILAEDDNSRVCNLLTNSTIDAHLEGLVASIKEMLTRNWIIEIKHIYRAANLVADYLTSLGAKMACGMKELVSPLGEVNY